MGHFVLTALVKSRNIDRKNNVSMSRANLYFFVESAIALFVSFLINVFVVSVFASGLYGKTNYEIHSECIHANNSHADVFPINNETVSADIYKGLYYIFLYKKKYFKILF